jgi:hypothetical protein
LPTSILQEWWSYRLVGRKMSGGVAVNRQAAVEPWRDVCGIKLAA